MKALFIGLGGVGQRHLRNLLRLQPDAALGAVRHTGRSFEIGYDLKPDYSVDIMEKYRIARFASLDEGIAWRPDFAVVASPSSAHLAQVAALVRGGVPVFLEKPISSQAEGLDELLELTRAAGVPVMVGYMFRFHPGVRRFQELFAARAVGRVRTVHVLLHSYMPAWHSYEKYNDFYAGRKDLGGGAVLSEIHELDLVTAMLGTPGRVWSTGGTLSDLDLDVEDTACALMEFSLDGRLVPATLQMSFVQRPPARTITVYGERGSLSWDAMASRVVLADAENGASEEDFSGFERNRMFEEELAHFLECVRDKKEPLTSLAAVMPGHRLALAIRDGLGRES